MMIHMLFYHIDIISFWFIIGMAAVMKSVTSKPFQSFDRLTGQILLLYFGTRHPFNYAIIFSLPHKFCKYLKTTCCVQF